MNTTLAQLIKISVATGKDPALVQGTGGNTSVKTDDGKFMFIKASGTALKNMNKTRGWRKLQLDAVLKIIKDSRLAAKPPAKREPEVINRLLNTCRDNLKTDAKPSVEAHLHALLDKCVIHLHPLAVGAYVNAKNGRTEIEKLFKNRKYPPLWIPCAIPGFTLAKKVTQLVSSYQKLHKTKPSVMFLAKHGLCVTASSPGRAIALAKQVIKKCTDNLPKPKTPKLSPPAERHVRSAASEIRKAISDVTGKATTVSHFFNKNIAAFIARPDAQKLLAVPPLGAAELVYTNGPPLWLDSSKKIAAQIKRLIRNKQKPPTAFVAKDLGLFVSAGRKITPVIAEVAIGSLMVRNWASHFGGVIGLSPAEQKFIRKWEAALSTCQ